MSHRKKAEAGARASALTRRNLTLCYPVYPQVILWWCIRPWVGRSTTSRGDIT